MIDHPDHKIKKNDRLHPGRRLCELKASGDFEMKGPHDRKHIDRPLNAGSYSRFRQIRRNARFSMIG